MCTGSTDNPQCTQFRTEYIVLKCKHKFWYLSRKMGACWCHQHIYGVYKAACIEPRLLLILLVCNFLHFEIQIFIQVKSSGQMEVQACERLIKYLVSVGLNIRVFATDRSTTIRTMMAAVFPWIKHQFDIW